MAGTISLSLQQQFNASTGELLVGGLLYFFASGTTTPQNAYQDAGLGTAFPNPITLAADGRVPNLWFADGTVRARLVYSGVTQFDADNLPIVGSSGGGGVDTTDPNSVLSTGDMKFRLYQGTLSGWVRANSRTIGSASSGASERANADTQSLYEYIWNNFSDTLCPVSGGRGANATADFDADKPIATPDLRGRTIFGLDDMGNSAASRVTAATYATPTTAGTGGGAETHTLSEAELASHTHTASVTDPGHGHTVTNGSSIWANTAGASGLSVGSNTTNVSLSAASNTTGISVSNSSTGSGNGHNNMPPGVLGTWYLRL